MSLHTAALAGEVAACVLSVQQETHSDTSSNTAGGSSDSSRVDRVAATHVSRGRPVRARVSSAGGASGVFQGLSDSDGNDSDVSSQPVVLSPLRSALASSKVDVGDRWERDSTDSSAPLPCRELLDALASCSCWRSCDQPRSCGTRKYVLAWHAPALTCAHAPRCCACPVSGAPAWNTAWICVRCSCE